MKHLVLALAFAVPAVAQLEVPPGTTSSVPQEQTPATTQPSALSKAEDAIADNKFEDAIALLTPLATEAQTNERVFYDLGFAHDALNHDTEATAAYSKAIKLHPNDAAARISLGLLYARNDETARAQEQLHAATKIEGADKALLGRAWRALAEIDLKSNPAQARGDMLSALQYSPETADDAATAAEIAEAMQDNDAATKAYAHAFELNPSSIDVATGYARALSRVKRYSEADQVLTSALQQHPGNHTLLAERASELLLQGKTNEALPALESLHSQDSKNAPIAMLLARAYGAQGNLEKAQSIYSALLASSPDDVTLLAEAADNLIRLHRSSEAQPLLQKALDHPEKFPSQQTMADAAGEMAFAASANKDGAYVLKALALREQVTPLTAPYTFLRATAHDMLHHTRQAAEDYRLFLSQSGGKFPDQEWQAGQRLQILVRTK